MVGDLFGDMFGPSPVDRAQEAMKQARAHDLRQRQRKAAAQSQLRRKWIDGVAYLPAVDVADMMSAEGLTDSVSLRRVRKARER